MSILGVFVFFPLASFAILAASGGADEGNEIVNTRFDFCDSFFTGSRAPIELVNSGFSERRINGSPDACYLIFNNDGDTENKVNHQRGKLFSFELNVARKICKRYWATLVTVRTHEELVEVTHLGGPSMPYYAMGATVRRTHNKGNKSYWEIVEWDDNLTSTIENKPKRPNFKELTSPPVQDDDGAAILVSSPDDYCKQCGPLASWQVVKFQTGIDDKIGLVCKQNLTTMKNNIPPRSPLIKDDAEVAPLDTSIDVDMCDTKARWKHNIHEDIYGRSGANGICYFEIKKAIDVVNTEFQPGYYHFSFKKARSMCHKYGSTLLTLRDYDEVLYAEEAHAIEKHDFSALGVEIKRIRDEGYNTFWELGKWDDDLPGITHQQLAKHGREKDMKGIYHPNTNDTLGVLVKSLGETVFGLTFFLFQESAGIREKVHFYCKQNLTNLKSGTRKTTNPSPCEKETEAGEGAEDPGGTGWSTRSTSNTGDPGVGGNKPGETSAGAIVTSAWIFVVGFAGLIKI